MRASWSFVNMLTLAAAENSWVKGSRLALLSSSYLLALVGEDHGPFRYKWCITRVQDGTLYGPLHLSGLAELKVILHFLK